MLIDVDKFVVDCIEAYCECRGIDRTVVNTIFDDCLRKQGLEIKDHKLVGKKVGLDRKLRHKKDEPLWKWVERLSKALNMTDEQKVAMFEVSKVSYIDGVRSAQELENRFNK